MTPLNDLPKPECPLGYTTGQVQEILTAQGRRYERFLHWMRGQTMALCTGQEHDYETNTPIDTPCAAHPHGPIVYQDDLIRFLSGGHVVD